MALGALSTGLGMVKGLLTSIGETMGSLGGIANSIGNALAGAFNAASVAARKAFNAMSDFYKENLEPKFQAFADKAGPAFDIISNGFKTLAETMSAIWNGVVIPIFSFFKDYASMVFSLFTGDFEGAAAKAKGIFEDHIMPIATSLDKAFGGVVGNLKEAMTAAFGIFSTVSGQIGDAFSTIYDTVVQPILDGISGAIDFIVGGIGTILKGLADIGSSVIGGAVGIGKKLGGGAKSLIGGGGGSDAGTTVEGGVSQTFNITVNAGGITDRSDKRSLATEIGRMIQEETARSVGGSRYASR